MSLSPYNILNKLEELKKWQQNQQKRLMEEHYRRLKSVNTENSYNSENEENLETGLHNFNDNPKEELELNVSENAVVADESGKPKRQFLRKGSGLARYRMTADRQFKAKPSTVPKLDTKASEHKQISNFKQLDRNISKKATWEVVLRENDDKSTTSVPQLTPSLHDNSAATERELLIFETLENRVAQSSFCSTNSSILRLLSSTPHKGTPIKTIFQQQNRIRSIYESSEDEQSKKEIIDDEEQLCFPLDENTPNKLEIRGSDNSEIENIVQKNHQIIEKNNQKFKVIEDYEKKLQDDYLMLIQKAIKFKECVAADDDVASCSSSSVTSADLEGPEVSEGTSTLKHFDDESKWSDCQSDVLTSEKSSVSSHKSEVKQVVKKCDSETMTDLTWPVEEQRLVDVEVEMKQIRTENLKVTKLKNQLEQQERSFERHKKEVSKQVEEERQKINNLLQEERKKLAKEKMVFEQYVKDSHNKPSRKEREEISALKLEVAALQETLKLKETKSGTTQARLRNQIKMLEKKNADLEAQIINLNKQTARLLASQNSRKNPTETKILHQINKNLTKLAQEQFGKLNSKTDVNESIDGFECTIKKQSRARISVHQEVDRNKENECSSDLLEEIQSNHSSNSIEDYYEQTFGKSKFLDTSDRKSTDRTEQISDDGSKCVQYNNGNVKSISPDGNVVTFKYFNGDIKETNLLKGTIRYFYSKSQVNHTTKADGSEIIEYPDGQIETRLKNGKCSVEYPNGIKRHLSQDLEKICYPDGTIVTNKKDGEKIIELPNGQREVHTNEQKRREYPDGTIKILYPNGLQETRYANGRIRLKDKDGKLLMDSHSNDNT